MELTERQKHLIKYMLENQNSYIPVNKLAKLLNVSSKTIYRELNVLEKITHLKIIKKQGLGITIEFNDNNFLKIINDDINSLSKRRYDIYYDLLIKSPKYTSISTLSDKYFVSNSSIVNDIKFIQKNLLNNSLKLEKTNNGTRIIGTEENIRNSINNLITIFKDTHNDSSRINNETYQKLVEKFSKENVIIVEQAIKNLENQLLYNLGEIYYINLITHILISINRLQNGNFISTKYSKFDENKNSYILSLINDLVSFLEQHFKIQINENEKEHLYNYINSLGRAEINNNIFINKIDDIDEFINIMKNKGYNLQKDSYIFNSFYLHTESMINRIKYNISISNPLLSEIKKTYRKTFNDISNNIKLLNDNNILKKANDNEIAYLTIYFQTVVEQKIKNAIIVCSSGVGTSILLKKRLYKHFPNIKIIDILSLEKLKSYNLDNIDFIISSIYLKIDKPTIFVNVLLNETDIKNIKNFLNEEC